MLRSLYMKYWQTNKQQLDYLQQTNTSQTLHSQRITFDIYQSLYMSFDRSRSFEVIDYCINRKLIYNLLLVINSDLSFILHWYKMQCAL